MSNIATHFEMLMPLDEQERIGVTADREEHMRVMRVLSEYAELKAALAQADDWQKKARQELVDLRAEHKDVLDCACKDDPDATDGINGWAKRIQAERDALREKLAQAERERADWALQEAGVWRGFIIGAFALYPERLKELVGDEKDFSADDAASLVQTLLVENTALRTQLAEAQKRIDTLENILRRVEAERDDGRDARDEAQKQLVELRGALNSADGELKRQDACWGSTERASGLTYNFERGCIKTERDRIATALASTASLAGFELVSKSEQWELKVQITALQKALKISRAANCLCSYGKAQEDAVEAANAALDLLPKDLAGKVVVEASDTTAAHPDKSTGYWCGRCGHAMIFNVPRMGPDGGFVHADTHFLECADGKLAQLRARYGNPHIGPLQGPDRIADGSTDQMGVVAAKH